jgi:hypothetical protein
MLRLYRAKNIGHRFVHDEIRRRIALCLIRGGRKSTPAGADLWRGDHIRRIED